MTVRATLGRAAALGVSAAAFALYGPGATATQPVQRSPDVDAARCLLGETPDYVQRMLRVTVNNSDTRREPVFLQRPCGALLARLKDLEALRIRTAGKPVVMIDGEPYLNLNAYDKLTFVLNEAEQTLRIDGEPEIFYPTVLDMAAREAPPPMAAAPGAFLNYGLFAAQSEEREEPDLSGSLGLGIFSGERILLSDWIYFRQAATEEVYRLDTTLVQDLPERVSTLRLGDVITRGSAFGGGAAVAGVQYGTNFSTRPNMSITPVQILEAATRQTAAVDLYTNPQDPERASRAAFLGGLTTVPHGPVELINVPSYNNGEYELLLRDSLGREVLVRQPYFFNGGLLRAGLHDFSYEAGVQRRSFAGEEYAGALVSGTHRYGFSNRFTAEAHAAASEKGGIAGSTGLWAVPYIGVVGATAAASGSTLVDAFGWLGALSLENRFDRFAFALREDCQTAEFLPPTVDVLPPSTPKCRTVAALSTGLPRNVSLGLSAAQASYRGADDVTSARVGLTSRLWHGAQLTAFAGWTRAAEEDVSVGLYFSTSLAALGRRSFSPLRGVTATRSQLSASASGDQQGVTRAQARLSSGARLGDTAVGVQAATALTGPSQQALTLSGAAPLFNLVGGVQSNQGLENYAAGATSAFAWIDGRVLPSRPLYSSFALVRLGAENAGVRVNGYRTDDEGDVLVSPLQAYAANPVSVAGADLPMNVRFDSLTETVTPRWRAGVVVRPRIEHVRDAMLTVHVYDASGTPVPIPTGAYAVRPGSDERFPAGEDGAIYVAGLDVNGTVTVTYRGKSCELDVDLPAEQPRDGIPEVGPLLCEGVTP